MSEVAAASRPRETRPAAWCAAILSPLWPGAGHAYAGRFRRGVLWLVATLGVQVVLLAALLSSIERGPLLALVGGLLLAFWTAVAVDAARCARRAPPTTAGARGIALLAGVGLVTGVLGGLAAAGMTRAVVYRSPTSSMEPTLLAGDRFLADLHAYDDAGPRRGDLIVYRLPRDRDRLFVKRVAALPGETVEVRAGRLRVGALDVGDADRPYEEDEPAPIVVDGYYVLGDSKSSFDSRRRGHGLVPRADVVGRVVRVVWSQDEEGRTRWNRVGLRPR